MANIRSQALNGIASFGPPIVDAVYYPTGTTSPTNVIFYNNTNVGSSYPEGHIIKEVDYTIPQAADIWVRGRFAGSIKVEISYYE